MGCGVSKFDPEELSPACKLEPTILKQPRVDEIRARQNNEQIIKPMTLVSNLSFKHYIRENDKSSSVYDQNHHLVKSNVSSPITEEESRHDLDNYVKVEDKSDDEFGDIEGEAFERKDSLVDNPGSPSFRDYCLINGHTSIHDEEDPRATDMRTDNAHKERGINSNITSRKSIEKYGRSRKWRRPRNALPKNDSKSVKHIWHVSTCYNPNFARSQDTPTSHNSGSLS